MTVELADEASRDGVEVSGSFAGVVASLVDVNGCRPAGAVFTGSELEGIVGAEGLRGVVIGADQVIPMALAVFSALRIRVLDEQNG